MPTFTTRNLELYFQQAPVADLTALAAVDTIGIVDGLTIEVSAAGIFKFETPAVATPDALNVIAGFGGGNWIRQTLPALKATAGGTIAAGSLASVNNSSVLVTNGSGVSSWATSLTQNTTGNATTATTATNIAAGIANNIPYQTAANTTSFISAANSGVLVSSSTGVPSMLTAGTTGQFLSASTAGTPAWSTATYPQTTTINQLQYSSAANVVGGLVTGNSSVLVTDSSGVPSLGTTLPAVAAGACTCTDPTTLASGSLNTALSNIYSAIVPPAESAAAATSVSLSVVVATAQIITGAQVVLPPGKYLLSYSSSQTFTPTITNIGNTVSATTFIYNTTGVAPIANTSFTALNGNAVTGSEIFGGTASATVVATLGVTTTLDVYTQLNSAATAGATFSADYTTITAVRLANTQTTYSANGALAADSTSTLPQIVTSAQLVLPAGNYLLSYSAAQSLTTQVADASTTFIATAYIYNTTGAAIVANTTYKSFSGFATAGSEVFGGTASSTVAVTLATTTTLDAYIQLSAASAGADTYTVNATMIAVKLS